MTIQEYEALCISSKEPRFAYGDVVTNTRTGFPGIGTVIAMMPACVFCNMKQINGNPYWDKMFPGWENEYIYIVKVNGEPRRNQTYEEYISTLNTALYTEEGMRAFYESLTKYQTMVYLEQDLEPF